MLRCMKTVCDTIIFADWIITQDEDRTILENAAMAVKDGAVLALGAAADMQSGYDAAQTIRRPRSILAPGLINAHTHAPMALLRGLADDLELMHWLQEYIFPVEKQHTPESVHLGALLGCAELASLGVTCFNDMHFMHKEVGRAAQTLGLRCIVSEGIFGFPTPAYPDREGAIALVRAGFDEYRDDPLVRCAIGPHAVYTTSPDLLQTTFALAEEYDALWQIHLAESPDETAQSLEMFGKRPVAYCDGLGLLTERSLCVHAVDLNEAEIQLFAERGVSVAHCPESNMKLCSGGARVPELIAAGVPVGLGTDGPASNNNQNMFTEMTSCALLHKHVNRDPASMEAQSVLDAATRNAARAIGWPELGSLEPGRPADCVLLDASAPNMQPVYQPVSQLVYAATGREVVLTMVNGAVIFREGVFMGVDYAALLDEADAMRNSIMQRIAK